MAKVPVKEDNSYPEGRTGGGAKKLWGPATKQRHENPGPDGGIVEKPSPKLRRGR